MGCCDKLPIVRLSETDEHVHAISSDLHFYRVSTSGLMQGTFRLQYAGATTRPLFHNASAASVQEALMELPTVGVVSVEAEGDATLGRTLSPSRRVLLESDVHRKRSPLSHS